MQSAGLLLAVCLGLAGCGAREVVLTGERLNPWADLDAPSDFEKGDVARPISLPPPVTQGNWTHRAGNAAHDMPHAALRAQIVPVWTAGIGAGESRKFRITADPVVAGGRVFTADSRARVMAHSTSGAPLWSRDLVPPGESRDAASGAGLAVDGQRLYVTTAFGDLVALDAATGVPLWTQELGAAPAGAPTVLDGTVFVVARDATAWAVDAANGKVRWTLPGTPSPSGVVGGAAPAAQGQLVVLPFASRELIGARAAGGTPVWTANVAGRRLGRVYARIGDISGDPVIDGGTVYAGSPSGRINAFDFATGDQLWSAEEGAMSPVVVAGGSVFAVTDRAELVRLDAGTGARIWGTKLPYFIAAKLKKRQGVTAHYGPVLAGGRLWVASTDGLLRAFDPVSGALTATAPLPGGAASNPVVANNTLYVISKRGQLLAFR
nr:PQQ-binding-like beta-propeller repeat protein [Oceaniovalibus guishaninsula]